MDIDIVRDKPENITDLCDDILIKIFSYLDIYDRIIVLPHVCKRFTKIAPKIVPKVKEISSKDFETKWNETSISKLFRKVGPGVEKVTINYYFTPQMNTGESYLNLIKQEMHRNCSNIITLHIQPMITVQNVKNLPKTIRNIVIDKFQGNMLDLRYLNNLETLKLGLEDIPNGLEWIKVANRLKKMTLKLNCNTTIIKNISTIDQLLSTISDESSVHIDMYSDFDELNFDSLCNILHLKKLYVSEIATDCESINIMLRSLAEKNDVTNITIGSISSPTYPTIRPQTILSLLRWTSLERMFVHSSELIHSLIASFTEMFVLKNIRMHCGPLPLPPNAHYMDISIVKLNKIVKFFQDFEMFELYPKSGKIIIQLEINDESILKKFCRQFLHGASQVVVYTMRKRVAVVIEAYV